MSSNYDDEYGGNDCEDYQDYEDYEDYEETGWHDNDDCYDEASYDDDHGEDDDDHGEDDDEDDHDDEYWAA